VSTFGRPIVAGVDSKGTQYVRGTWTDFKEGVEGKLELKDPKVAKFVRGQKNKPVEIPYEKVTSLEYGQRAGRRIGATIGWGVTTLGVAALPILLSKKRKHYFRVGYDDAAGAKQGVAPQLANDITRQTITVLRPARANSRTQGIRPQPRNGTHLTMPVVLPNRGLKVLKATIAFQFTFSIYEKDK
jgi:hypothetical protein